MSLNLTYRRCSGFFLRFGHSQLLGVIHFIVHIKCTLTQFLVGQASCAASKEFSNSRIEFLVQIVFEFQTRDMALYSQL